MNIRVYNKLPEATSIHWHGLDVPNVMDGVPEVEPSPEIKPNTYFDYHFKITNPPGTYMYHTHLDSTRQEMMGLGGAFIILEPNGCMYNKQSDFFIMLHEFNVNGLEMGEVKQGIYNIDPFTDDFNFFTMNGRCYPFVTPLIVQYGENVRIKLGNIGMNPHPIHIHGHQFLVFASDGNTIPINNRLIKSTILVASGETWDVEFQANNPGIWPLHCHISDHMSNNMQMPMGGIVTVIKYQ